MIVGCEAINFSKNLKSEFITYSVISSSAHLGLEHTAEEVNTGGS